MEESTLDGGNGRIESRYIATCKVTPEQIGWPGAQQIILVKRERYIVQTGKTKIEYSYYITSCNQKNYNPLSLLFLIRGHWGIENGNHHRCDVTFNEDRCLVRQRNAARILSSFRKMSIELLNRANHNSKKKTYMPEFRLGMVLEMNKTIKSVTSPQ